MIEGRIYKLNDNPNPKGNRTGQIRSDDGQIWYLNDSNLAPGVTFAALRLNARVSFSRDNQPTANQNPAAKNIRLAVPSLSLSGVTTPATATASASAWPIPYAFTPVLPDLAVTDTPVPHDGSHEKPLWSGELLVTLTALTPLLVGNHQRKLNKTQNQLEPQRLDDGRVVLAATSLKGMLRGALASLLCAPMARVTEHVYTYRPNLGFAQGTARYDVRPAVITQVNTDTIEVAVLKNARAAVFVRDNAYCALGRPKGGTELNERCEGVAFDGNGRRLHSGTGETLNHIVLSYQGGIDGQGLLASVFTPPGKTYTHALVSLVELAEGDTLTIDKVTLDAYHATQKALSDTHHGHLAPGHPLLGDSSADNKRKISADAVSKAIKASAELKCHQLIYVEVEFQPGNNETPKAIVSLGHHFQYRWRYADSVRLNAAGALRPELAPLRDERPALADGPHAPPQILSAARLLFGYADDERAKSDPARDPFGRGDYARMAGRISPNMAVEIVPKDGKPRFLNESANCSVNFHVVGQPRPSAVEFYLQQEDLPKKLTTYGDLPGEKGGSLAGRKHYRHQPDAVNVQQCYEAPVNANANARGTQARFVSTPGSRFRFTLRFARLRDWELGALLCALEPERLDLHYGGLYAANPPGDSADPRFALKLGYGRPLGLGSVQLRADKLRVRQEGELTVSDESRDGETPIATKALDALKAKLGDAQERRSQLAQWLHLLAYRGQTRAAYPRIDDGDIFGFHSALRRAHAKARRSQQSTIPFAALSTLLKR